MLQWSAIVWLIVRDNRAYVRVVCAFMCEYVCLCVCAHVWLRFCVIRLFAFQRVIFPERECASTRVRKYTHVCVHEQYNDSWDDRDITRINNTIVHNTMELKNLSS